MNKVIERWNKNFELLVEADREAKEKGQLVRRYIKEQVNDGYAFYVIMKENKKSVRIKHVTGLGDDWMVRFWGRETTIPKTYAIKSIEGREALENIFSKK